MGEARLKIGLILDCNGRLKQNSEKDVSSLRISSKCMKGTMNGRGTA